MPRHLKRRSDAISRDPSDSSADEVQPPQPPRRRRRSSSSDSASSASSPPSTQSQENVFIKKLVRLALATEYSRIPLRRSDITTKIFRESNGSGRSFKAVFEGAQRALKSTFGMQLIELPSKEKTSLKDRRNQATQTKSSSNSNKSWILVSILPEQYKSNPLIARPTRAPNADLEASYTALYTFILSLIYLNNNCLPEQKLERYLRRVNAETYTPLGSLDKLLQRMVKEGYLEKRRDTSSGEEVIEWTPGPRGKVEVGVRGVAGLVKSVYGHGAVKLRNEPARRRPGGGGEEDDDNNDGQENGGGGHVVKMELEELNAKLSRSLGITIGEDGTAQKASRDGNDQKGTEDELAEEEDEEEEDDGQPGPSNQRPAHVRGEARQKKQQQSGRMRARRTARDDDDDEVDG